jgi:DNA-binding transcriptional regulator YdaS (Cro superfamily)
MTPREAIEHAIEMFGSEYKLADAIGFSQSAIWRAKTIGRPTPEMAVNIEVATNGKIKREMMRPDVFARPPKMITNAWPRGTARTPRPRPRRRVA